MSKSLSDSPENRSGLELFMRLYKKIYKDKDWNWDSGRFEDIGLDKDEYRWLKYTISPYAENSEKDDLADFLRSKYGKKHKIIDFSDLYDIIPGEYVIGLDVCFFDRKGHKHNVIVEGTL